MGWNMDEYGLELRPEEAMSPAYFGVIDRSSPGSLDRFELVYSGTNAYGSFNRLSAGAFLERVACSSRSRLIHRTWRHCHAERRLSRISSPLNFDSVFHYDRQSPVSKLSSGLKRQSDAAWPFAFRTRSPTCSTWWLCGPSDVIVRDVLIWGCTRRQPTHLSPLSAFAYFGA